MSGVRCETAPRSVILQASVGSLFSCICISPRLVWALRTSGFSSGGGKNECSSCSLAAERTDGQHHKTGCFHQILNHLIYMGTPPALVLFHCLVVFRLNLLFYKETDAEEKGVEALRYKPEGCGYETR
jgi:hypothetical protein